MHRATKERQWKHPGSSAAKASVPAAVTTEGITKRKAATRRSSIAGAGAGGTGKVCKDSLMTADSVGDDVKVVERYSKKLSVSDKKALDAMLASTADPDASADSASTSSAASSSSPLADRIAAARSEAAAAAANLDPTSSPVFGEVSVTQMEFLGLETKSGYLMKQSSILGMYVILSNFPIMYG